MWYGFFTAVGSFRIPVWQPDSIETGATAAYQPSTTTGTPSWGFKSPSPHQRFHRLTGGPAAVARWVLRGGMALRMDPYQVPVNQEIDSL